MKLRMGYFVIVTVIALASCVSNSKSVPKITELLSNATGQDGRACVRVSDIQGYGVQKDQVVMIDAIRDYYIATVHPGCFDLGTSMRVAFKGDFDQVCGKRMDKIITGDGDCTLSQMFKFKTREEAFEVYHRVVNTRAEALEEDRQTGKKPAESIEQTSP